MIKQETRWFVYAFAEIICILLSILTWDFLLMPQINAFLLFGSIFIFFMILVDLWFENWRWQTEQVIFNIKTDDLSGHCSIRSKDIDHIIWDIPKVVDKVVTATERMDMTVMLTGGTDHSFYSGPGHCTSPVLIFPEENEVEIAGNYACLGNLGPCSVDNILGNLSEKLLNQYPKRVKAPKTFLWWSYGGTPIYFGFTSRMNGTATRGNLYLESIIKQLNMNEKMLKSEIKSRDEMLQKKDLISNKQDVVIARERGKNE